jgi:hypothetical protein
VVPPLFFRIESFSTKKLILGANGMRTMRGAMARSVLLFLPDIL